jgi:hypothetical protein
MQFNVKLEFDLEFWVGVKVGVLVGLLFSSWAGFPKCLKEWWRVFII